MKNVIILLFYVSISPLAYSSNAKHYQVSEVVSIYDGDTFRVNIEALPDIIGKNIPIRINGIDTPELRGKCKQEISKARQAKQFTVQQLRAGGNIQLKDIQRGKYFRLIADVYIDGVNLGNQLLEKGLAVEYRKNKPKFNWCKHSV